MSLVLYCCCCCWCYYFKLKKEERAKENRNSFNDLWSDCWRACMLRGHKGRGRRNKKSAQEKTQQHQNWFSFLYLFGCNAMGAPIQSPKHRCSKWKFNNNKSDSGQLGHPEIPNWTESDNKSQNSFHFFVCANFWCFVFSFLFCACSSSNRSD